MGMRSTAMMTVRGLLPHVANGVTHCFTKLGFRRPGANHFAAHNDGDLRDM